MENGQAILTICSMHRMAYVWGILLIITILFLVASLVTRKYANEPDPRYHFYLPYWVVPIPLIFGLLYTTQMYRNNDISYIAEKLEFSLSDMSKKEYLNFKVGDDRTNTNFLASATSATILTGSALLGPFLRGDR